MSHFAGRAGIALGVVVALLIGAGSASAVAGWTPTSTYEVLTNLDGRSSPRLADRAVVDHLRTGERVRIECQITGEPAYGSRVWDRVRGLYVPDKYIRTHTDGFLPGAPRCKGPAAKPPPPRKPVARAACDAVREDQQVKLSFAQRYTRHAYDRTQVPSKDIWRVPDKVIPMGSLTIGAATCKSGGRWRVLSPLAVDYSSTGLDENAKPKGKGDAEGLGLSLAAGRGPQSTRDGLLEVDAIACNKGRLFSLAGQVADTIAPRLIAKVAKPVLKTALKTAYKLARHQLPEDKVKMPAVLQVPHPDLRVAERQAHCVRGVDRVPPADLQRAGSGRQSQPHRLDDVGA